MAFKDSEAVVLMYLRKAEHELGAAPRAGLSPLAGELRRARAMHYLLKAEIVSLRLLHGDTIEDEPIEE